MFRYRLRTLLLLTILGPPALAVQWFFFTQSEFGQSMLAWVIVGCLDAVFVFYLLVACATAFARIENRP